MKKLICGLLLSLFGLSMLYVATGLFIVLTPKNKSIGYKKKAEANKTLFAAPAVSC
ncbi:hypothetical protein [Pontibacter saemangeumensis]|uniref:hypothetical protein n=1 Tax=Pontibacter saemangeumensis TaxID=1084525 RepID=UPI0031E9449A